jgi:hypothetical protein
MRFAVMLILAMSTGATALGSPGDSATASVVVNCVPDLFNYHSVNGNWDHPCTSPTTPSSCSYVHQTLVISESSGWTISAYEYTAKYSVSGEDVRISLNRQSGLITVQWADPSPNSNQGLNTVTGHCMKATENKL